MDLLNANTLFLYAGLAVLALNIVISLVQFQRCRFRADFLNVALALVGGALAAVGLFQLSFPAITNGTALGVTIVAAIVVIVAGVGLFLNERHRLGFDPSHSPGLLHTGLGVFVLAAALVIPALPGQLTAQAVAQAPTVTPISTRGPVATRVVKQTSTPTDTQTPTLTPTDLPTLTMTPFDPPTDTPTSELVASALATETIVPISCTISSQMMVTIRPDPSVNQQSIGRVLPGIPVPVTGRTQDGKWWRVHYSDGIISGLDGWVSALYMTPGPSCTDGTVPVVVISATPSRTPLPSRTPYPSRTPRPTATITPLFGG